VALTKYLGEDVDRALPDPALYKGQHADDLDLYDPAYESVTSDKRVAIARDIDAVASKLSDKVISAESGYSDTIYEGVKVHTNGFEGARTSTRFSAGASVTVDDGNGGLPQNWAWGSTRKLEDLPDGASQAKAAVDKALAMIGQSKMDSGSYDMVIENRVVPRLLGSLFGPLSGSSLHRKASFLEGMKGEQIGSELFTVIDDPFIKRGLGSRTYDGEGLAAKRRAIFDKGVLKEYFIDCYYGKKLGMAPTTGGASNIVLEPGEKSLDEIIKSIQKGILVTSFIGGNSNSLTGDYSYGVFGQYIENGVIVKPVNEMNISGNHTDLWKKLVEIGNDPYVYSSWRTPAFHFSEMEFAGL
jgi:PmbA protein